MSEFNKEGAKEYLSLHSWRPREWAERRGSKPDPLLCCLSVATGGRSMDFHQCNRKAVCTLEGYQLCRQHKEDAERRYTKHEYLREKPEDAVTADTRANIGLVEDELKCHRDRLALLLSPLRVGDKFEDAETGFLYTVSRVWLDLGEPVVTGVRITKTKGAKAGRGEKFGFKYTKLIRVADESATPE